MRKIYIILLIVLSTNCFGQSNTFKWVNNTDESGFVSYDYRGNNMAVSPNGKNYYTGKFAGTKDFDRGEGTHNLTSVGDFDAFISKYDTDGKLIWAKQIGSVGTDYGFALTLDNDENVIVAGLCLGSADFDFGPGVVNIAPGAYYIAKYDSSAALDWVIPIGQLTYHIEADASGNILVTGKNIVSKYNSLGVLQWSHTLTNITGRSIATYPNGDVVLSGYFQGTVDFDPGAGVFNLTASGIKDAFIVKLDASGNFIWAFSVGGSSALYGGFDEASSIVIDSNGDICVVGNFATTVDFDPGPGVQNYTASLFASQGAFYFAKYDANGNYIFAYKLLGNMSSLGVDLSPRMAIDVNDNLYITGWHWSGNVGTVSPMNVVSNGGPDIFVAKYTNAGVGIFAFSMGSNSTDFPNTIGVDQNENIYLNGNFVAPAEFNPHPSFTNTLTQGTQFFAKYGPCIDPDVPTLSATAHTICSGDSTVISVGQNDDLNDALVWRLYDGGCGVGTAIAENDSGIFIVYPTANTTYSIRGESGGCITLGACDDITINVNPVYNATESDTVCIGSSYAFPDGTIQSNIAVQVVHTSVLQTINNCDSIIVTTVNVHPLVASTDVQTACNSYVWIDGNTYTTNNNTATFNVVGGAANGCDSLVTLDLTILNSTTGTDTRTECSPFVWIDGNTYTANNNTATFNVVGGAANGCDSIVTLNLTILNSATGTDVQTACNSYLWIDGNTYTANNTTAKDTLVGAAANGCDSIVTLNLTILNSATGTDVQTACNSYLWIDGNTYTANNTTAKDTLVGAAANGCDSIVTLNLTILNSATGTDVQTACNSYLWIDGNTYTSNNTTAKDTIVGGAFNGCDSIVTLNLTIFNTVTSTDTRTECSPFVWIDGNTYTTNNTTAKDTLVAGAANGCDSIVTLNLTITIVDTSVTQTGTDLTANELVATYQWLDCDNNYAVIPGETFRTYYVLADGNYAVEVTYYGCADTSSCYNVIVSSVAENTVNNNITIYPNPVKNQLTITAENEKINSIKIIDVTGKTLKTVVANTTTINVADLAKGIYFLQIQTEKGIGTKRFIKE